MKIRVFWIGKAKYSAVSELVEIYESRLTHYVDFDIIELKDSSSKGKSSLLLAEAQSIIKKIDKKDYNICLDEHGKSYTSVGLSRKLEWFQNSSTRNINIIIGGPFGFHQSIQEICKEKWALSKFTLPHDLCRVIILEQLYRAFTILKGEKYHNP